MAPSPNAWWSKEIGKDLTRGMLEPHRDAMAAWRRLSPKQRIGRLTFMMSILVLEAAIGYALYVFLTRSAR